VLAKSKKNDILTKKQDSKPKKEEKKSQKEKVVESDPVITDDSPAMSLSQLKHVAPKKFKQTSGKKPKIDSTSVKEMIKKTQAGDK
jgi:hypothetical protein